ncbi:MAG TPA: hypothetical protein VLN73_05245, partial [Alphaproteobacteria bacterium]|nr:hypothetical protein [Alphaproteobacteria bacterium]
MRERQVDLVAPGVAHEMPDVVFHLTNKAKSPVGVGLVATVGEGRGGGVEKEADATEAFMVKVP